MTLAALTPLVTWWPLFFGLLVLIAKMVCPPIRRRQAMPWPPPKYKDYTHSPVWLPAWELDAVVPELLPPPRPWTRVAS